MADRLPLTGITVIDCGHMVAGPTVATILGDFGAEVIKVEHPIGGDQLRFYGRRKGDVPLYWKSLGRNKKSVTLALNKPAGQELLCRLIEQTQPDVLIESFRPGTLERWNLGYERLRALCPRLTLVRVSGFGQTGPYRDRAGFGTLAEAMSGFAHMTGEADGPPTLPPFPLGDPVTALYATIGVMISLYQRDLGGDGEGQCIDASLLESLYSLFGLYAVEYDQLGVIAHRVGNRAGSAPRNTYLTKDGRWIALAAATQSIAERVFRAIGRPDLIDDPRFRTNNDRVAHVEEVDALVGDWIGERTQAEAIAELLAAEVAVAPICDFRDLAEDPQLQSRGAHAAVPDPELGTVRMPNVVPSLSKTPGRIRHAGPRLRQHNWEIYHDRLGLSKAELADLQAQGVI